MTIDYAAEMCRR